MLSRMQLADLQMEFVASVSHELRTPLSVIRSAADNLADGVIRDREAMRKYGAILQHQSRSMGDLVDQILLFASTEDRSNRYILQPVSVPRLIDSAIANTEGVVHGAGFTLDVKIDPDLPAALGDLGGIAQCLQNLIGNAVKYGGDDGRIVIRASRFASNHGSPEELRISVADRGMGIDSSDIPFHLRSFLPQSPGSGGADSRHRPGAVVGQEDRRSDGGQADSGESALGRQHIHPAPSICKRRRPGGGRDDIPVDPVITYMNEHILIVEDEQELCMTLGDRLRSEGYEVDCAFDGKAGFEKVIEAPFDLVILDIMLPMRSGLDLCVDIRRSGITTPILILTALSQSIEKVAGLKSGSRRLRHQTFRYPRIDG